MTTVTQHARTWPKSLWLQLRRLWDAMWDDSQRYRFCVGDPVRFLQDDGRISSIGCAVLSYAPPSVGVNPCIDNEIVVVMDSSWQISDVFYTQVSHNPSRRVFRLSRLFRGPWRWVKSIIPLKAGGLWR